MEKTIEPALTAGQTVVSDRFADSTRVYQGAARAALRAKVDALHAAMIGLEPDLTLVIDMDPEAALARTQRRRSVPGRCCNAARAIASCASVEVGAKRGVTA